MSQIHKLNLYNPHPGQIKGHASRKRFNILAWGRQSGKTTYGLNKIIDRAWTLDRPYINRPKFTNLSPNAKVDAVFWYILQTHDAAQIAFKRLYKIYRECPSVFDKKPNESELSMRLKHGPEISFKSGWNYEDLRAETLDGVVIDEYRQQPQQLLPMVIRPMLGRHLGWADVLSTPNGFEHFYDLFEAAKTDPDWGWFHAPSTIAPWWTPEEIESARKSMTEAEFAQEIMAEFRDMQKGKAYSSFSNDNINEINPFAPGLEANPYLPVELYMDFNVHRMGWSLSQFKHGEGHYQFDEIFGLDNTHQAIEEFIYRFNRLEILANPAVVLIGDASGKSNKTSAAGETDYTIIHQALNRANITFVDMTPAANPHVKDRVQTMNTRFKNADGQKFIQVHPRCKYSIRDYQRVVWKETSAGAMLDQVTNKELTHLSDGFGYGVYVRNPITAEGAAGGLRMVRR